MAKITAAILTCKVGNHVLESPIILSCGSSICEKHVKDYFLEGEKSIKCPICEETHQMPKNGFTRNEIAESLLEVKITEKHEKARNVIKQLDSVINERKKLIDDSECYIHDFIQEIRFQIDEKAEKDAKCIYDQRDEMLLKLTDFEKECKVKAKKLGKERLSSDLFELVAAQFKEWNEKVNQIFVQDAISEEIKQSAEKALETLQKDISKSKCAVLQNSLVHFKPSKNEIKLGILFMTQSDVRVNFLTENLTSSLKKLTGFQDDLILIYQANSLTDAFSTTNFHAKCDGIPKTLTIIKSTKGYIFGGYTEQTWDSVLECPTLTSYKKDPNAFIFSLVNKDNKPTIFKAKNEHSAILCGSTIGPTFFDDLHICDSCCSSDLGNSYSTDIKAMSAKAHSFLTGSKNFKMTDIAVFQRK